MHTSIFRDIVFVSLFEAASLHVWIVTNGQLKLNKYFKLCKKKQKKKRNLQQHEKWPLWLLIETAKSQKTAFPCLAFVSVSYLTQRHRKTQTELFMWRTIHTAKNCFQKLQVPCFTEKSETCRTSTFWFMRHYICHRLIAATCSQWGKHHKTSKLCKDADTRTSSKSHKHKPLCTLHNISCPEGCTPHCNCPYETGDL